MEKRNYIEVVKKLIEKEISIATAESITGGLLAKMITDVSGSSNILKESFVVYSDEAKVDILGVPKSLIEKYGVVSSEVALSMAENLHRLTKRDICVSTTGNAGPTVCDNKPVGRVYVGIKINNETNVYACDFTGERSVVREETAEFVFSKIWELLY